MPQKVLPLQMDRETHPCFTIWLLAPLSQLLDGTSLCIHLVVEESRQETLAGNRWGCASSSA